MNFNPGRHAPDPTLNHYTLLPPWRGVIYADTSKLAVRCPNKEKGRAFSEIRTVHKNPEATKWLAFEKAGKATA